MTDSEWLDMNLETVTRLIDATLDLEMKCESLRIEMKAMKEKIKKHLESKND